MVNFANDVEREEDYEIGWDWIEEDTGPLIGPYTGFCQCLLDPLKNKPEDFFNELFDVRMYTIMAEETNKYTRRRKQNRKCCIIGSIRMNILMLDTRNVEQTKDVRMYT